MLTGAFHYRNDEHSERQLGFIRTPAAGNPFVNAGYAEPWQTSEEETYSLALENVWSLNGAVDLVVGASYDWTNLKAVTDVNVTAGGAAMAPAPVVTPVSYPLKDFDALNAQAALTWDATPDVRLHASASSRARFPNLFERFSQRFGTAIPNADIEPERATNYEVGGAIDFGPNVTLESAVFYSDITDALVQVPVALGAPFGTVNQTRNATSAEYTGLELSITASLAEGFDFGGNLTLMERWFDKAGTAPSTTPDPSNPNFRPQGVPDLKAFLYASMSPFAGFTVTPSLEIASDRWTVTSSSAITPPRFYETGAYALVNMSADWTISPSVDLLFTIRNLADENYVLVDGFPEEGRNVTLSLKLRN